MRYAGKPSEQWLSALTRREDFDATMAKGVPQDHMCDEDEQSHRMGRQEQQDQGEESSVHDGFAYVKTIGRKWRWIVGAVMQHV